MGTLQYRSYTGVIRRISLQAGSSDLKE
uniref:Uncharacterized protein n=1 Tax=Arundo donax TaxID=35708 RepID=A0A0A8XWX2_ARUDO